MHKNFSSDRKVLEDAIHEVTKIYPPEGQLWVGCSPRRKPIELAILIWPNKYNPVIALKNDHDESLVLVIFEVLPYYPSYQTPRGQLYTLRNRDRNIEQTKH